MTTSEIINPNFEEKITNLKADHTVHRVTFNPNKALPGKTLFIPVPKLSDEVVLVPGSLAVIFDLTVSGQANNFLVNNVSRALVNRLTVKFAGEILQDTDGYDLFKLYEDLFFKKCSWIVIGFSINCKLSRKLFECRFTFFHFELFFFFFFKYFVDFFFEFF